MASELWVFGYGSLIWKVDFPTVLGVPGYIEGYRRRLWQGSTDHRGVPGAPGRVATLLTKQEVEELGLDGEGGPEGSYRVDGIAYQIPETSRAAVLDHLDFREKGGYARESVDVSLRDPLPDGRSVLHGVLVYRATPSNPEFLGPPSEGGAAAIATHVLCSSGPSGPNLQYVSRLHRALISHGIQDDHVAQIMEEISLIHTGPLD